MTKPNGWRHDVPVYIQGRSGDLTLIQYVTRPRIGGRWMHGLDGRQFYRPPIPRWEWVPSDEVLTNEELHEIVRKLGEVA